MDISALLSLVLKVGIVSLIAFLILGTITVSLSVLIDEDKIVKPFRAFLAFIGVLTGIVANIVAMIFKICLVSTVVLLIIKIVS